jgi:hypothetical protein
LIRHFPLYPGSNQVKWPTRSGETRHTYQAKTRLEKRGVVSTPRPVRSARSDVETQRRDILEEASRP